jgi:hypothetical protein
VKTPRNGLGKGEGMDGKPLTTGKRKGRSEIIRIWMIVAVIIAVIAVPCLYTAIRSWDMASELRNTPAMTKMLEIQIVGMPLHQEWEHRRAVDAGRLEQQAREWLVGGAAVISAVLIYPVLVLRRNKRLAKP